MIVILAALLTSLIKNDWIIKPNLKCTNTKDFEQEGKSDLRLEEESASGKLKGSATSGPHVHT